MAVSFDLRVGDALSIDSGRIVMTLKEKSGRSAKVSIDADKAVPVQKIRGMVPAAVPAANGVVRPK